MSIEVLIDELALSQSLVAALLEDHQDGYNRQTHTDLSPLGWHLGHCVYTECYWLHEIIRGENRITAPIEDLYTPPRTPKAERGSQLPPGDILLNWATDLQASNIDYIKDLQAQQVSHPLLENNYLIHFLIQHYSQHYETMLMILTQQTLENPGNSFTPAQVLTSKSLSTERTVIPAGHYRIGGQPPVAYDNELPPQHAELGPFSISRKPVSNAEFLEFIEAGAYRQESLWCTSGWQWLQQHDVACPEHWQQNRQGHWFGIGLRGAYELAADEPVMGISHYEAVAFAKRADARLPHEYQWETACRLGELEQTGRAWEWAANTFHSYQGFKPFPYDEYSKAWFDDKHYSLRGGSLYTRPAIKRPSFRNFYHPDKRHIFAGLRLAW